MKCPICKGEMELKEADVGVARLKSDFFHCVNCGENLVFENQFNKLMDKIINFKKHQYVTTLVRSGNSLVLRIPAKLAKSMSIKEGSKMHISPVSRGFVAELA